MKHFVAHIFFLFVMVFPSTNLLCQKVLDKSMVRQLFPNTTKNLWIHLLEGSLDGTFGLQMVLGTDGHTCKGYYKATSTDEIYYFEGTDDESKITLTEFKDDGIPIGFIVGSYDGQRLSGLWRDKLKSNTMNLDLHYVDKFSVPMTNNCTDPDKIMYYSGKLHGQNITVQLYQHDKLSEFVMKSKNLNIKEATPFQNSLRLNYTFNLNGQDIVMSLDTTENDKLQITSANDIFTWSPETSIKFQCTEKLDFSTGYKMAFPTMGEKNFDAWILSKMKSMVKSADPNQKSKDKRWKYLSDIWSEIHYVDKNLVSGCIYAHDSRSIDPSKEQFTYDISSHKPLSVDALLNNDIELKKWLATYIDKYFQSMKAETKKQFSKSDFKYIYLTTDGLAVSTNFNTIYGEETMQVPYSEMHDILKDKYKYLAE